jgi:uncharacterized protein (DUF433 family)
MTATLVLTPIPQPLRVDEHGTVRVGRTRIPLDTVVFAYQQGDRPEEIAENFDTLDLADIYATISYYLRHRQEVDAYLAEREREAEALRRELESRSPPDGLRERLLARRRAAQT